MTDDPIKEADIETAEHVLHVAEERFPEYHKRIVRAAHTWTWHDGQSATDFEGVSLDGTNFYFTGRDSGGDSVQCDMPYEYALGTQAEFEARLVAAEAVTAQNARCAQQRLEDERRRAVEERDRAEREARDHIFREEAARRGIKVSS